MSRTPSREYRCDSLDFGAPGRCVPAGRSGRGPAGIGMTTPRRADRAYTKWNCLVTVRTMPSPASRRLRDAVPTTTRTRMHPERSERLQCLINAAGLAVDKTPKSSSSKYHRVSALRAVPERGPGRFRFAAPKNFKLERLEEAVLAPASGPGKRKYQLLDSSLELPWLYVRAASSAPEKGMSLWATAFDLRQLAEALRDSLREISSDSLAERFASRALDPIPTKGASRSGLRGAQAEAFRTCCGPQPADRHAAPR